MIKLATAVALALVVASAALLAPASGPDGSAAVARHAGAPETAAGRPLGQDARGTFEDIGRIKESVRKTDVLAPQLDYLHRIDVLVRALGRALDPDRLPVDLAALVSAGHLRFDDADRVQVYVETRGDLDATAGALAALGMVVERTNEDAGIVQGRLPVAALAAAAALPGVTSVRPPDYAVRHQGSVTSQGDTVLNAAGMRALYRVNGHGVKVGVISNGMEGLAASQASGDLPANVNTTTCDMIPSAPPGEPADPTDPGAGAEGTAMLEIVHDLAPGAELWFGYFGFHLTNGGTSLDFMAAVQCLSMHVDVVIDDIGYFNAGLYDGTSAISMNASTELNKLTNRIRGYYNAVGNQARVHYQEPFVDSSFDLSDGFDTWDIHRFQATASTTDGGQGLPCTGNPADAFCADTVFLAPGGVVTVLLQWNDPWGASSNDYDMFLFDGVDFVTWSAGIQDGTQNPTEAMAWQNVTGSTQILDIFIGRWSGAARTFDMFILCSGCALIGGIAQHNFNTVSSSVPNNSDAGGGVMSLGTVNHGSPNTIASYSSRGPTNDGRTKPDATGVDGVSVTGNGGFPSTFFGTSAAAPHAGAIAALLLSCAPHLKHGHAGEDPAAERTALRNALLNSAVDLGPAGVDNTFGSGRLDAAAAANAAGCSPDTSGDGYTDAAKIALGADPFHYCATMRADVDHDAFVTALDIATVIEVLDQSVPPANPRYDQDADNFMTALDISWVISTLDMTVTDCP